MLQLTGEMMRIIRSDRAKRDEKARLRRLSRQNARRLSDERMRRLVDNAARILRAGKPTLFAFEGACRHGLRNSLVAEKWAWGDADGCAAEIVSRALTQLGAVRPTWDQGQPEHAENFTTLRFYCDRCGGLLDEEDRGRRRYCSKLCSSVAGKAIASKSGEAVSLAEYLARLAMRREEKLEAMSGNCETCGAPFIGSAPGIRFCSRACISEARIKHAVRPCPRCGEDFKPVVRGGGEVSKFCSQACAVASRGPREKAPRPQVACEGCGEIFSLKYASKPQRFCSLSCSSRRPRNRSAFRCEPVSEPQEWDFQKGGR